MNPEKNVRETIAHNFPGLFERIKLLIEETESLYDKNIRDSHLWEHSMNVAAIALRLARKENTDPLPAVLTALFHDSGKFMGGDYHENEVPEETASSASAEQILREFNAPDILVENIVRSIGALYRKGRARNKITDIVHDADFLSKSGPLGIGEFFIKGALRGENLINRVINSATKELTYSENITANMRTGAGRGMAARDRAFTRKFFVTLFDDLKRKGITDLTIDEMKVRADKCSKHLRIVAVSERSCVNCGRKPVFSTSFETGIKCEKLILSLNCRVCRKQIRETSFCLPEICN